MAENWHIARRTRTCAGTGARIDPGRPFYSALVESGDDFQRLDFDPEAWPAVDKSGFFSYWRNKPGDSEGKGDKPKVDFERVLSFFDSLENSQEPGRRLFRYVLALILVRRRLLRLDDMSRTPEGDRLLVFDRRSQKTLEILAPEATREEFDATQDKLNDLFDCDFS